MAHVDPRYGDWNSWNSVSNWSEKMYKIPRKWIEELFHKGLIPIGSYVNSEEDFYYCSKLASKNICQKYLHITDRNWWPTLLGKSEIMDKILDEEFKK
jgi:hypothetical protein